MPHGLSPTTPSLRSSLYFHLLVQFAPRILVLYYPSPAYKTPHLTLSKAGICSPSPPPPLLLRCVLLTNPSDDKPSLLGHHSSFWSGAFVYIFSLLSFCFRRPPHASLPISTSRLATDNRLTPRKRLPLYALPSPTDPRYYQPLRISPSIPLARPHPFGSRPPLKNHLGIHKLGLIFNSTVEASS